MFEFVVFLLFPILIVVTLVKVLSPKNKGRRLKITGMLLGLPFLIFFADELVGQLYLHARCAIDGGAVRHTTVNTEGYFNPNEDEGCGSECVHALVDRKFHYYETEVRRKHAYYTRDLGVHRFFLAQKRSGDCVEGHLNPPAYVRSRVPSDKCIGRALLKTPDSKYEVSVWNELPIWPYSRMHKNFSYVKDRASGAIVASDTSYWWWGGWLRNNAFSHNSATVCPTIGSYDSDVRKVITPN